MCPSWVTIAKRHIWHLSCWGWAATKGRWTDRRGCRISVTRHLPLITAKTEMTGTFSGRIVSLPTFYLGSPFGIPLRNKSKAKPPPSMRREATLDHAVMWRMKLVSARNLGPWSNQPALLTLQLELLFQPLQPAGILCITCASVVLVLNVHQDGNLWTEKASSSGRGSFWYLCLASRGLRPWPCFLASPLLHFVLRSA